MGSLNFEGVEFPVKTDGRAFERIEKLNDLAISVYALRDEDCTKEAFKKNLFLLYKSKSERRTIQLFYFKEH